MNFTDGMWSHSGIKCPNCGGNNTEINLMEVLTSLPAKFNYRCKCGHHWIASEYEPNINYQDILPPQKKINGSYGWICPVCGAGVSPYQDYCPCCSGKSLTPTWPCGNGVTYLTNANPDYDAAVEVYTNTKTEEKYNGNK